MGRTKSIFISILIVLFSSFSLTGCTNDSSQSYDSLTTTCININSASKNELTEIIHIGEVRAEDLIQKRPFSSLNDMKRIDGIADARLRDMKNQGLACVR